MKKTIQAKHISDEAFAEAIRATATPWGSSSWSRVTAHLGFPAKVVLAKARSFDRRGLLDQSISCTCGCSGNWKLAELPPNAGGDDGEDA